MVDSYSVAGVYCRGDMVSSVRDEILDFNVECSVVFIVVLVWMLKMCLSRAKYMRNE